MSWEEVCPQARDRVLDTLPPYPIVLVTTRSNVITVNQIGYFSFSPLRLGIGVAHSRYSYSLLRDEGEFVVNIPGTALLDAVQICGSVSGRDCDKFREAGLQKAESLRVRAVSLPQCGAQIECRVSREMAFEERTWFIGEVVAARKQPGHRGEEALMCGRHNYMVPGEIVASR